MKTTPQIVVPVDHGLSVLRPCFSRNSFLLHRSKSNPRPLLSLNPGTMTTLSSCFFFFFSLSYRASPTGHASRCVRWLGKCENVRSARSSFLLLLFLRDSLSLSLDPLLCRARPISRSLFSPSKTLREARREAQAQQERRGRARTQSQGVRTRQERGCPSLSRTRACPW